VVELVERVVGVARGQKEAVRRACAREREGGNTTFVYAPLVTTPRIPPVEGFSSTAWPCLSGTNFTAQSHSIKADRRRRYADIVSPAALPPGSRKITHYHPCAPL
jgi:hypothetical protein